MSGLLVVSEVSVAIETAEQINSLAGEEVAGVYYSISDKNPQDRLWHTVEYLPRIAIITHAMFINRSDSGKDVEKLRIFHGHQRDITIIDERIDLIKRVSFGTDEIGDAVAILKRDGSLNIIAEALIGFNDILFTTKTSGTYVYGNKFKQVHEDLRKEILSLLGGLDAGQYNIKQRMRGKIRNTDAERSNVKDLLGRIAYVIGNRYTHTIEGRNVVCHREEDLSGKFGSVVVLDATASINPEYVYRATNYHNIAMINRIASRNYSNVTLNVCTLSGPNQSKSAIYTDPKRNNKLDEIIQAYLKVIGCILMPEDKLLVVTYKDVVPLFTDRNPFNDQVKFIHWGSKDARGSNDFKDFNKALIIGWLRKPAHFYVSSVMAIKRWFIFLVQFL